MILISGSKSVKFAQKLCIFLKFLTLEGTLCAGISCSTKTVKTASLFCIEDILSMAIPSTNAGVKIAFA